ncbi:MAG TPA: glycosyltransferase family A protein [Cellulomonas sp.]|uniref:glycosyltransferase family 2 protein n=1 Tax=Cellulomonas sp. TaxID=40001 RepID=UPI002E3665E7|nr:glycosyltransferase family A protein [Cellulomonas sp.]HEX5333033.1 glycosyltransferase family A protein [Cellulomonas sp.]
MTEHDRVVTVVIPAHNEESVIGRCLATLLAEAEPDEFAVLVVSNGSTDHTVSRAQSVRGSRGASARVLELPEPSKVAAVRAGMSLAAAGAVIVLDADVELPTRAARALRDVLANPLPIVAYPTLRLDTTAASWVVRRYYAVWTALPYVTESMVGSGVFALNAPARAQLGELPDVVNDDGWVRHSFPPERRVVVPDEVTVYSARTARALVARRARIVNGNRALAHDLGHDEATKRGSVVLRQLRLGRVRAPDVVVFGAMTFLGRVAALVRRARHDAAWSTDQTSREIE